MPQKIKGVTNSDCRIITIDQSDYNTVETNTVVAAGPYDIEVAVSGTKTVIARGNSGEVEVYSNVGSVYEAPGYTDYTQDFVITPYTQYWEGYKYGSTFKYREWQVIFGRYNTYRYDTYSLFNSVTIPKDATILSAIFKTQIDVVPGGTVGLVAHCFDEDNPWWPNSSNDYDSRPLTTGTSMDVYPNPAGSVFSWPDVKNEIQQIVNRDNWNSGQRMVLCFKHDDVKDYNNGGRFATARGAEDYGKAYPKITISWRVYGS